MKLNGGGLLYDIVFDFRSDNWTVKRKEFTMKSYDFKNFLKSVLKNWMD